MYVRMSVGFSLCKLVERITRQNHFDKIWQKGELWFNDEPFRFRSFVK